MARHISCVFAAAVVLLVKITTIRGHGGMVEPPMRSIMWRYGFDSPVNYDWNALYCGGRQNFIKHKGKCGFCGDPVQGPYENDKGGVYDTGVIVRHYPAGLKEIEVKVELTAHHKGFFEFKLCVNNEGPITQECLNRYPLPIREGFDQGNPLKYFPPETPKLNELHVALPPGVICDRCVLQWTYTVGNSFGQAENGRGCVGCGYQETFVNCADISIGGTKDQVPVHKGQIQDGGVVEIGNGPEVTAVLDKAEPGASVSDILRELGVAVPGTQSPPRLNVPLIRGPPTVQPSPKTASESKPKVLETLPSVVNKRQQVSANPIKPHQENNKKVIPRPIPRSLNRRPISHIPILSRNIPNRQRWDIADPLQSDFYPIPHHNMLIDASIPGPGVQNNNVNEITRRRQQERIAEALARGPIESDALKPPRNPVMDIPVPNEHGSTKDQPLPLVDAVYTLRDHIPRPNTQEHIPQVDIYGRVHGLTPFRKPVRHDPFMQGRQLSAHYMDKLKQLGRDMHSSFTDYHNKQYRDSLHGVRSNSHFDNYLPHQTSDRLITESVHEVHIPRRTEFILPRRITVHSMSLAKRLVRRYPQLRGRVYLSRTAHSKNKYAHRIHRYARRHRYI